MGWVRKAEAEQKRTVRLEKNNIDIQHELVVLGEKINDLSEKRVVICKKIRKYEERCEEIKKKQEENTNRLVTLYEIERPILKPTVTMSPILKMVHRYSNYRLITPENFSLLDRKLSEEQRSECLKKLEIQNKTKEELGRISEKERYNMEMEPDVPGEPRYISWRCVGLHVKEYLYSLGVSNEYASKLCKHMKYIHSENNYIDTIANTYTFEPGKSIKIPGPNINYGSTLQMAKPFFSTSDYIIDIARDLPTGPSVKKLNSIIRE